MNNRIQKLTWEVRRLSAVEAEVWIHVQTENISTTAELRGRLVGPRCPGVTTVEVAYPIQPIGQADNTVKAKVVIPEPNLWTEKMPFVYQGPVELWEKGQCCDRTTVSVGLKSA